MFTARTYGAGLMRCVVCWLGGVGLIAGLMVGTAQWALARDEQPAILMVDDFNEGIQNRLGGHRNTYEAAPSSASVSLTSDVYRGEGGQSLSIHADKQEEGFCGLWIHFFDFRAQPRVYFDSRPWAYLSFWVRGEKGGESLAIKMADNSWIEKDDSVVIGYIEDFLPRGVTTEWQEVLIPLARIEQRLDRMNLGGLTFDFPSEGQYTVYIDDLSFKTGADVPTPMSKKMELSAEKARHFAKTMWVWSTQELLDDAQTRRELFEFCKQENVDLLWIQLIYRFEPDLDLSGSPQLSGEPAQTQCILLEQDKLRQFLREAHQEKIKVHALDGYPEYAQKEYHHGPLAVVDAVIAFNEQSSLDERFDGVHFDNEPYLLTGWQDWERRGQILQEFLDLNAECQRRIRASGQPGLEYGIDIPFWWNEKDQESGRYFGQVTYNGRTTSASYVLAEMLDNVGIMNYRDRADGADGMIAHGQDLLAYSDKAGGAGIYVGVETFMYQPVDVWFAVGLPHETFAQAIAGSANDFAHLSRARGFRLRTFDDGLNIHVGLELPASLTQQQEQQVKELMVEIVRRFGAGSYPQCADKQDQILKDAQFAVMADVEWHELRPHDIEDSSTNKKYPGFLATSIMLPKTTFADNTYEHLKSETKAAENFFAKFRSYRGIALHYYLTYRDLVRQSQERTQAKECP